MGALDVRSVCWFTLCVAITFASRDRARKRLPEKTWVNVQQLAEEYILFGAGAEIDLDPDIWHKLEDAWSQRKSVMMTYKENSASVKLSSKRTEI